jgi:hypothetical protein
MFAHIIVFVELDLSYLQTYYRAGSLISDIKLDLYLEKDEWVSVLKLSTIWNMEKVR